MVQLFPRLLEIGFDPGMAGMMMLASGLLALPGSYLCGVIDSKIGARKQHILHMYSVFLQCF